MSREDKVSLCKFDVPFVAFSGAHIEFFGNRKMVFEGKYSIVEYTETILRLKLSKQSFIVSGTELELCNLESERFTLVGKFSSCSFE